MSSLRYVGPTLTYSTIGTRDFVDAFAAQGISATDAQARIDTAFTDYATPSYVDAQDALRATTAQVQSGDGARLRLAEKGAANGVATLDSAGMVPLSQGPAVNGRAYGWMFSAGSYASGNQQVTATTQLKQLAIMNIPTAYTQYMDFFVHCWGGWECRGVSGSGRPYIEVRVGGTTGQIIARGMGSSRGVYHWITIFPLVTDPSPIPLSASGVNLYVYGRNTSSGTVEFSGVGAGQTQNTPPNLCGLLTPGYGISGQGL